ncbi:MAG: RNase III inhibitor [Eubacterium sp.]|jgi:transcriptional regulator with XRE-family HTH domain
MPFFIVKRDESELKIEAVLKPRIPARVTEGIGPGGTALSSAYVEALEDAAKVGLKSVALTSDAGSEAGYSVSEIIRSASLAAKEFAADHDTDVYLIVREAYDLPDDDALTAEVEKYVAANYSAQETKITAEQNHVFERSAATSAAQTRVNSDYAEYDGELSVGAAPEGLEFDLDEPFNETLFRLIDARGMTDAEVYKKANIDRKLFSKIRTGKGYLPRKRTILALAVALELDLDETKDLLEHAGYALSRSSRADVIVEYFIRNKIYDIYEINQMLFKYDLPLLGSVSN